MSDNDDEVEDIDKLLSSDAFVDVEDDEPGWSTAGDVKVDLPMPATEEEPAPEIISDEYLKEINDQETAMVKQLNTNIVKSLKIGTTMSVPHPVNPSDSLSLNRFVEKCEEVAERGYAVEASAALINAYKQVLHHIEEIVHGRVKNMAILIASLAIRRQKAIHMQLEELREWRSKGDEMTKELEETRAVREELEQQKATIKQFVNNVADPSFVAQMEARMTRLQTESLEHWKVMLRRDVEQWAHNLGLDISLTSKSAMPKVTTPAQPGHAEVKTDDSKTESTAKPEPMPTDQEEEQGE